MMTWNGFWFHSPNTTLMEFVTVMHDLVCMFMVFLLFVTLVDGVYLLGFSKSFTSNFSENHVLETYWTIVPLIMLSFIAVPSISTLYNMDSCVFCGVPVSIMGHQWYWSYFYKNSESLFDSYMTPSAESNIRLLEVDNRLVLPYSLPVRLLVSSADVIHSWTVPSFGLKMDAVPGRINQFCFSLKRPGIFFGQCSEICGANHSFMPIVVESVPFYSFLSLD